MFVLSQGSQRDSGLETVSLHETFCTACCDCRPRLRCGSRSTKHSSERSMKISSTQTFRVAAMASTAFFIFFPLLHAAVVLFNLIVHLFVLGLQFCCTLLPRKKAGAPARWKGTPFFSILVPAHNEPPELLAETLRSLAQLRWKQFEVLVVDNNTEDESLWRPVEALCKQLGPRFRFLHVEGLKGAKAGAINWARPLIDPRAEFLFVIDADYVLEPEALRRAVRYADEDVGLVQFPQDYRNIGPGNTGMALDFRHFFSAYMHMANQLGCVPSTGTLTLIRVSALDEVHGFNPGVVTEDADLGFRLNSAGHRTVYADEVIGRGLMPHDLEAVKKQRWRWAFGNAQILKLNWRQLVFGRELSPRQKLGYLVHLTAWFNFNLIPSLSLIALAPLVLLERLHPVHPYLIVLSGFTLTTFMFLRFGTLYSSLRRDGHTVREIANAFVTHVGLGWIFGISWIRCLWDHHSPFVRTNKFLTAAVPGVLRNTMAELLLGIGLVIACIVLTMADFILGPVAAVAMSLGRFMIYWVWWQSKATWRISVALHKQATGQLEQSLADVAPEAGELQLVES